METHKNFWRKFWDSLNNFKAYKYFAGLKISEAFAYFFTLIFLASLLATYNTGMLIINKTSKWLDRHPFPAITVKKGEASSPVTQPYTIYEEESNGKKFLAILDTTGATTNISNGVLIKKDAVTIVNQLGGEVRTESLAKFPDMVITEASIKKTLSTYIWFVLLPWLVMVYTLKNLFLVIMLSLFSLLANSIYHNKLTYSQIFNLGIFALTPAVVLELIFAFARIEFPGFLWIYLGVYLFYLTMGLNQASKEDIPTPPAL
jgi:hypothetical protein